MKQSHFRKWLHNIWVENCDEHIELNIPRFTKQEYWEKYKWWLRREYRYQTKW